jgi:hypothetical protein
MEMPMRSDRLLEWRYDRENGRWWATTMYNGGGPGGAMTRPTLRELREICQDRSLALGFAGACLRRGRPAGPALN